MESGYQLSKINMHDSPFNVKTMLKAFIFSLFIIVLTVYFQINDRRTKIVFCDVGQGDAAYIRIKNKIDIIIDAGPDRKILNCLGKYMPFWDRKIELAILSHPNTDHYNGFFYLLDRYHLDKFITVNSPMTSKTYKQLVKKIYEKKISYQFIETGDSFRVLNDDFIFYWPPKNFQSSQDNDFSVVCLFEENEFKALFTGDASPFVLDRLSHQSLGKIDILKVPHHGSKNGLTKNFLQVISPRLAVISVGKNNPYGHPAKKILEMLKAENVKVKRTDINGDIIFKLPN